MSPANVDLHSLLALAGWREGRRVLTDKYEIVLGRHGYVVTDQARGVLSEFSGLTVHQQVAGGVEILLTCGVNATGSLAFDIPGDRRRARSGGAASGSQTTDAGDAQFLQHILHASACLVGAVYERYSRPEWTVAARTYILEDGRAVLVEAGWHYASVAGSLREAWDCCIRADSAGLTNVVLDTVEINALKKRYGIEHC